MRNEYLHLNSPNCRGVISGFFAVFAILNTVASAGRPLEQYDFSLRFPAAVSRFASYADVAALGNAQAASQWSSSINPASAAWQSGKGNPVFGISPQYTRVHFAEDTNLSIFTEAVTLDEGNWGTFLPSVAQIRSNDVLDLNAVGFKFDANYYQFQWGRRLGDDWAIGFNFNLTTSDIRDDIPDLELARAQSESYDFRLGILRQILPKLRFGLVLDYAFAPTRTDTLTVDPLTFLPGYVRTNDTTQQFLARAGIAWEYLPGGTFYLDFQGGIFSNATGTLKVYRFPIGIEQGLFKDLLFLRAGATFDSRGEVALTTGLGISIGKVASIDLAYQRNAFPEIMPEFGRAQSFVVSVSIGF